MAERIIDKGLVIEGMVFLAKVSREEECKACKKKSDCAPSERIDIRGAKGDTGQMWVQTVRGRHVGEVGCAIAKPRVN